jgi:hypothetical protein
MKYIIIIIIIIIIITTTTTTTTTIDFVAVYLIDTVSMSLARRSLTV